MARLTRDVLQASSATDENRAGPSGALEARSGRGSPGFCARGDLAAQADAERIDEPLWQNLDEAPSRRLDLPRFLILFPVPIPLEA